ncbi:NAD(P)H-binding protein [Dellaglioa sp. BT-FLS60]
MKTILILGAYGQTAQIVTKRLLAETDDQLVLFLRKASRLAQYQNEPRVSVIEGDTKEVSQLTRAMDNVDIIYSNVGGTDLAETTKSILAAMKAAGKQRLIFYNALGAYHEVPGKFGEWNEQAIGAYLPGFRASATLIDAAPIEATQVRPAWLTDNAEIDYELTSRDEAFKGTEVSRQSVADFLVKLMKQPDQYIGDSIGLDKAGTDGDKPAWI